MERKIRVAAVSYLNTKPLVYGFEHGMMPSGMEIIFEYPAKIAAELINDSVDIGLVPVAIIPQLKESHILSDYCIGADGEVASVCLFSDVPLHEIKSVYLDYQSRTSVALLKILLKELYKISPELLPAKPGFESKIKNNVAGLVIGDRAFKQRKISKFSFDLSSGWKTLTGLPFVFAAWIANKKLPQSFVSEFNNAINFGIQNLDSVVAENYYENYNIETYFKQNIKYDFDEEKRKGLDLFLSKIKA